MVLPPLELLSLGSSCPVAGRLFPFLPADCAAPHVDRVHTFEDRIFGPTARASRRIELRHFDSGLIDNVLRDGPGGNLARLVQLIGSHHDAGAGRVRVGSESWAIDPP